MDGNGWSDIGYTFLVGGDGSIFEGRGWNVVGAHTYGFNSVGYGIDFIGTFTSKNPTQAAQDAYKAFAAVGFKKIMLEKHCNCMVLSFFQCAMGQGKVWDNYECKGHRQTGSTECPGNTFYATISSEPYPHWVKLFLPNLLAIYIKNNFFLD